MNYSPTMWSRIELKSNLCGIINRLLKISEKAEPCSSECSRQAQRYCEVCGGLLWWKLTETDCKILHVYACLFGGRSRFNYLVKVICGFPKFNTVVLVAGIVEYLARARLSHFTYMNSDNPENTTGSRYCYYLHSTNGRGNGGPEILNISPMVT